MTVGEQLLPQPWSTTILQFLNSCWPNVGLTKTILQLVNSCWPYVDPMLEYQRQPSTNQPNHLPTLAQRMIAILDCTNLIQQYYQLINSQKLFFVRLITYIFIRLILHYFRNLILRVRHQNKLAIHWFIKMCCFLYIYRHP